MRTTTTAPRPLRGDEAELYATYAARLERHVARRVNTDPDTVADACQEAWRILLARQPDRPTVYGWLCKTAEREAWRLDGSRRKACPATNLPAGPNHEATAERLLELLDDPRAELEPRSRARLGLELIASLPPRKRRILALAVLGYRYAEIAELNGDTVRTTERQLVRAWRLLDDRLALERSEPGTASHAILAAAVTAALRRSAAAERRNQATADQGGEHAHPRS